MELCRHELFKRSKTIALPYLKSASSSLQLRCRNFSALACLTTEPASNGLRVLTDHPNIEVSLLLQEGFSEFSDPIIGRATHCFCLRHSLHLNLFHHNTLINMYFKFGSADAALFLFNHMHQRNDASWNTTISGCVRAAYFMKAFELLREMRAEGFSPNGFVLASLVTACDRWVDATIHGFSIHALALKAGLKSNVYVGTALLHLYGMCGFILDVQRFFEEMPERNVVSWTALMVSFSKNGYAEEAMRAYWKMRREGIVCNENSFTMAISSCVLLENEMLSVQVVAHAVVSGFEADVSVANSLISLFGNLGRMQEAEHIFERMEARDMISWNSMISVYSHEGMCQESFQLFSDMRSYNLKPDASTLSSLISVAALDHLKLGRGVHALCLKDGLYFFESVVNSLINMYSIAGKYEDVDFLFQNMARRDLISWNTRIASYAQRGNYIDALKTLKQLLQTNEGLDTTTFVSALTACSNPEALFNGRMIHAFAIHIGLHNHLSVGNAVISMYSKCNSMQEAELVFRSMPTCDVVTYNVLIGGHVENEQQMRALQVFAQLRGAGMRANYITIVNVLGAISSSHYLIRYGMPIHAHTVSTGFESDEYIGNSLITMYAKCGDLKSSSYMFESMVVKSAVSWNAMIVAKAQHNQGEDALKLLMKMRHEGNELDQFSLSGGLAASASLALLEEGQQLHSLGVKLGFDSNLHVMNAAMDMYGKCGKMDEMLKLLPKPTVRPQQSWNILISGYARHGCIDQAEDTFRQMLWMGRKPDHVTFVGLLSACNHAGLVDKGLGYLNSMTSDFGVPLGIEHCVCMVDLFGRLGRLTEAERFIEEMPILANDLIWRSLLSSSRTHRNLDVGRKAAQRLLELDPLDDSAYVLLSNLYVATGRWTEVGKLREHMKSINLNKRPACSWIKLKNEVVSFGVGDKTHMQAKEIYAKLEEVLLMVRQLGYVADTSPALHDLDDEQKEQNLWNHSEKLALAYGLISIPEGSMLRIFKNLRVCGDCHLVFKIVSRAVDREIMLRDPYRFHHFKGGDCSCSDFW